MNAAELFATLGTDSGPLAILAFADTDDAAPDHITNVAHLTQTRPGLPIPPDVAQFFTDWHATQIEQQSRARVMLGLLHRHHPLPTADDIIAGAGFPAWFGTDWAMTLSQPWSGRLGAAVTDAVNWLAANAAPIVIDGEL